MAALALLSVPLSSPRSATQTNCTVLGAQCKMEIWYPSSKLQNEGGNSRTLNQAWIPWERWPPCDGPGHIPLKQPKTEVTASQFPDQSLVDELRVGKGIMVLWGGTEELMCGLQSLPSPATVAWSPHLSWWSHQMETEQNRSEDSCSRQSPGPRKEPCGRRH